jgi:uncharacterized protein
MRATTLHAVLLIAMTGGSGAAICLPRAQVTIETSGGPKMFSVEVASDSASQQRGLMFRRELQPNGGMLFEFHSSTSQSFWMKDTVLSLDILFIRSDGTISTIAAQTVPLSTTPIRSTEPVRAVLEISGGRARELGIRPGDRVLGTIVHNEN